VDDEVDPARLVKLIQTLTAQGGALQSTGGGDGDGIRNEDIHRGLVSRLQQAASGSDSAPGRPAIEGSGPPIAGVASGDPVSDVTFAARLIQRAAADAVAKISAGSSAAALTDIEHDALQAIVEVVGRPALRYLDGRVQLPPGNTRGNERWHVLVATARSKVNRVSASVARIGIDTPGGGFRHLGTGWRLGEDLLVTNRHVVEAAVADASVPVADWKLASGRTFSADFAATDSPSRPARFQILSLDYCAPEEPIDFAVLRLKPAADLPTSLPIAASPAASASSAGTDGTVIYVVGHPYRTEVTTEIAQVFGFADGKKRCSPGLITRTYPGTPIFEHDCSTLAGNSGSCVFDRELHEVVGLHVGGSDVDPTAVGRANVAVAFARLNGHRASDIVSRARL
jgi:hypothetical protein